VKLYYAGDVHGSEKCWRKFLNAARFYEVDTLIMGGDITGKLMVPVVAAGNGSHQAQVLGRLETVPTADLDELEKRIRFNGFYPYRCDRDEYSRLESDIAYRDEVFTRLMVDEVRRWIALAEERLRDTGIRCYVMPGNDDEFAIDSALESGYVINPDNKVVRVGDHQMLSSSWTNPTPWNSPREEDEDALGRRFNDLAAQLEPGVPTIFNLHCPPHGTTLDKAPELSSDLRVLTDGGEPRIVSVGSKAVRALIEEVQPVLSLHGHIHESKAVARIGRTTCVNPGSAYSEGVIDGAVVDVRGDKVKSCQLVTG
jgi:Icc-related predicted phosphoesterase